MAKINATTDLTREDDVAVLTLDYPPVNALSADVRNGLHDGIEQAAGDPAVKAIIFICAGRTFIAGADIADFGKTSTGASMLQIQAAIEGAPKPVIAAVHGTALGGGFEIALMCHYRIAVLSAKFGLPEIKLGLIPGGGGTQRLTRLIGVEKALEVILSGPRSTLSRL
jgi:3-hydroxyacyl-CoA dehydrogenase